MRLIWKFFLSYLLVAAISLCVLALSTALFTPVSFSDYMVGRMGMGNGVNNGNGAGNGMGRGYMGGGIGSGGNNMMPMTAIDDDLDTQFHNAVNDALLRAGIAAFVAAGVLSWFVSRSIIAPIRRLSAASNTIAEGHYDQRLDYAQRDELGDLTSSFNRMAAALADTEAMRHQLIADVSHELKTPLSSIKGYMEGLQDGIIAATPETFQLIHDEATRLQRLTNDLQELSRAEASTELHRGAFPAGALVESAVARLRPQFSDKDVTLAVDAPDTLPVVLVDQDRAVQVLINLLGNALQYTPSGGTVQIRAQHSGDHILFAVQDSGVGLAPNDVTRVFHRFYRVDKSRSRSSGGSGIGLTIAQHIVETHGGRIWAESPGVNQGSTFSFTLPLA